MKPSHSAEKQRTIVCDNRQQLANKYNNKEP